MTEKQLQLDFGLPGLNEIIRVAKIPTKQRGKLVPGVAYATLKKTYTQLVPDRRIPESRSIVE